MAARRRSPPLAERLDRHRLYELSVQYAPAEVDFIDNAFRVLRGSRARLLREDFCGTANVCCEWVRRRKDNRAVGIDLDPEVLGWGEAHNLAALAPGQRKRVELVRGDVLRVTTEPPQIILAMNFSYWLFKGRKQLLRYFRRVYAALAPDGMLFLDAFGGYDAFREIVEEREIEGDGIRFTYVWEQERYEPVSGDLVTHIHFDLPDGSRIERAFSYDWRLWTLPEIRELLTEAGFRNVLVYWQGFDGDGEPDGVFEPVEEGEADAGWICYLSAER